MFMKERHLKGVEHALSIDEIMDETNQLDVGSSTKNVRVIVVKWINLITISKFCILVACDRGTAQQSQTWDDWRQIPFQANI